MWTLGVRSLLNLKTNSNEVMNLKYENVIVHIKQQVELIYNINFINIM